MFKRLAICLILLLAATCLPSAPAYSGWQECHLSDGTPVLLRLIGDEFYHYWESESGMLALEQPDGTFILTEQPIPESKEINRRRIAAGAHPQPNTAIGKPTPAPRGLVLLVQFTDTKFDASNDSAAFVDMFNKEGYNYNGASGSAADYFKAQSNGQYAPVFDVFGPITLSHDVAYYGAQGEKNGTTINDLYMADFVIDAVKAANKAGCDFSLYDADKDGSVDIIYLVYAGKGQADGGGANTIWPHNWKVSDAIGNGRTHNYLTAAAFLLTKYDGKYINNYACSAELKGSTGIVRAGIGTFCHEFSHVIGMPDYYVTSDDAANKGKKYTPGAWTVMDQGLYNNAGKTPPNYSAFDKYFMGWLTPKHLPKDKQTDVTITSDYDDVYQISGTTGVVKAYSNTSRMWYLENRRPTGWDEYLPGRGMCVWEVVYNSSDWTNNHPNNETVGYTIVTAKNQTRPYTPYSDKSGKNLVCGTTFPGTGKITTFTPAEGCALTNIAESKDGVITFRYNGGTPLPTEYQYSVLGEKCTYPANGVVDVAAPLELIITPDEGYTLADESCWMVEMGTDMLTYNVDFSYTPATSTFRIASVTGEVTILVEAIPYVPTSFDDSPSSRDNRPVLYLQNGVFYIIRNGKMYTIQGAEIK